jgi:spore maturation protein CgeB
MTVFTNEVISANKYLWNYIPHSYDPMVHRPVTPSGSCDVLMCGTGWPERQRLLESMSWDGIDLRLLGIWPDVNQDSPLFPFVHQACIDNLKMPEIYAGAKICLNIHRGHPEARSLNPRAYEVAACGAFQISDYRQEIDAVFGDSVPVFTSAADLEYLIRFYLTYDDERKFRSLVARERVFDCTFDERASGMIETIQRDIAMRRSEEFA